MKTNVGVCVVLALFIVFSSACVSLAVDTRAIDRVRDKDVLSNEDFQTIELFIKEALDELVDTKDFTQVATLRSKIVTRQSEQAQYAEQYTKFLRKYVAEAVSRSEEIEEAQKRHRVRVNLAILISELENPRLIDTALVLLDDPDRSVQYWAVRALANRRLIEKVEAASSNSSVVDKIASRFSVMVETAAPEVIRLIADFAGAAKGAQADELLLKIADVRISRYSSWTATGSLNDIKVLKLLCAKLQAKQHKTVEFGRRFAQLYSYVMQKYVMALKDRSLLDEQQRQELASVLVEIESKCIGKLTGFEQAVIKRAVELDDDNVLLMEHGRLLGDETKRGEIPTKLTFDYGAADDGGNLAQPRELPPPPKVSK